jgi:hypothetical protein
MKREVLDTNMADVVDFSNYKRKGLTFGGDGGGDNWLADVPPGSVIVCKRQNTPKDILALDLFFVLEHKDNLTNVMQKVPTGQQADMWVDTLEFSRYYKFKGTVATVKLGYEFDGTPEQEEEQTETTVNGNDKRSLHEGRLDNDAEPKG